VRRIGPGVVLLAILWLVTGAPAWAFMALGLGAAIGLVGVLAVAALMALGAIASGPPQRRHSHRPKPSH
jgi:hypothetical protein